MFSFICILDGYDHIQLNILNTTNSIDGHFADLKTNFIIIIN
ncbi:hypothetical protein CCAN11_1200004 [Capnocytophaga canimorsus]|uniref:Uncharacterized protein n=1 Tax=Capnocytophaga canimorsus TaxID=28188 RepID=A0A0B7I826_9FLAO|nr:hypothetical protein CCAN11_1200004 [Capnocytophaga canimorsus]